MIPLFNMASIVSSLGNEKELRLQKLFSSPVRFHLLYKSSHHGASISQLLSSFDTSGKFVLAVFLKSGLVRGAFMSKSLKHGNTFSDAEAFVFEIDNGGAKQFPVMNAAKAIRVSTQQGSAQTGTSETSVYSGLSFGAASMRPSQTSVSSGLFGSPAVHPSQTSVSSGFSFGASVTVPSQTSDSISFGACLNLKPENGGWYVNFCSDDIYGTTWPAETDVCCVDVELHRVQDLPDMLLKSWRQISWNDVTRENLRKDFVSYKQLVESLSRVKALLLGPVGSGKSSLINSIRSTMYKRIVHLPNIGTAAEGFTQKMKTYDIRVNPRGSQSALSLCDVKAVGNDDSPGLSSTDALAIIKGHIPEGYKFQKDAAISNTVSGYIADPTLSQQIHCVLFVLDATKITSYPSSLKTTFRRLHTNISELGIPQLILLTHVDQVCPAVAEDVMHVYSSRTVQDKMQKAAEMVGLPLSYILPVKNYVSQLTVDCNTDILLLSVVMSILLAVDDTFEDQHCIPALLKPENCSVEGSGLFD